MLVRGRCGFLNGFEGVSIEGVLSNRRRFRGFLCLFGGEVLL